MAEKRKYIIDHFSLSIDYLITASSIGIPEAQILVSMLNSIERERSLKLGTLKIFYDEGMNDERTYWYTEIENKEYVKNFQDKMWGTHHVKSILN